VLFKNKRILVFGDIMLDRYIWGDTSRISPEAPVPVVEVLRESCTAGGAANVALNLASLGLDVALCGLSGRDAVGDELVSILSRAGVSYSKALQIPGFSTVVKTRVMVRSQQLCRLDTEPPPEHHCPARHGVVDEVLKAVMSADAVLISDYAKGIVTQSVLDQILAAVKSTGAVSVIDPKPKRKLHFRGASVMTPNRSEALELAGLLDTGRGSAFPFKQVGTKIFEEYDPSFLVVTLGAEGMALYRSPDDFTLLPTAAREVYDVSGAGDTVVAVITAALAAGLSIKEAVSIANIAAGIVVAKVGTAVVTASELSQCLPSSLGSI